MDRKVLASPCFRCNSAISSCSLTTGCSRVTSMCIRMAVQGLMPYRNVPTQHSHSVSARTFSSADSTSNSQATTSSMAVSDGLRFTATDSCSARWKTTIHDASPSRCATASMSPHRSTRVQGPAMRKRADYNLIMAFLRHHFLPASSFQRKGLYLAERHSHALTYGS